MTTIREEIINISKQFPHLRFGQFLTNVCSYFVEDMLNITDNELLICCKQWVKIQKKV